MNAANRKQPGDAELNLGGALARVHVMLSAIERLSFELEDSAACGSGFNLLMAVEACTEVAIGLVVAMKEHLEGQGLSAAAQAVDAPSGVDIAQQLLLNLRTVDDADIDEASRNRLCAEHLSVAVDRARAADGSRWPDFAKAASYAMRVCVGGVALETRFDLRKLVRGLDGSRAGDRAAEPLAFSSASQLSGAQA